MCVHSPNQPNCHSWLHFHSRPVYDRNAGRLLPVCWHRHLHNKHASQSASYISFTGPGGECKHMCVGCQLPSLLGDKDSIRRMFPSEGSLARTRMSPPRPNSKADPPVICSAPCTTAPASLSHPDKNRHCAIFSEKKNPLHGAPRHPLTHRQQQPRSCRSSQASSVRSSAPHTLNQPLALSTESTLCTFDLLWFIPLLLAHTLSTLTAPAL